MNEIFIRILNMSITASYCIVIVLLIRFLLLRRQPKIFSYLLWGIVLFRLLCPVSIASPYSILPMNPETVLQEGIGWRNPPIIQVLWRENGRALPYADSLHDVQETGGTACGESAEEFPDGTAQAAAATTDGGTWIWRLLTGGVGARIWLAGMLLSAACGIGTAVRFTFFLQKATRVSDNVYEREGIPTPFVIGVVRPRIYLPAGLSEEERGYVLVHEQIHAARKDSLVKILAWTARCVHWFNPLVWLAFSLLEKDMEMACDEAVLRKLGEDKRQAYSRALLALSCERKAVGACPLAFGEGDVKSRILNILTYRRRALAVFIMAAALTALVVLGLCCNPAVNAQKQKSEAMLALATEYANAFVGRDGSAMVALYVDEETALANMIMPDKTDGLYSFGYSSPWPDEYSLTVDEEAQKAFIRYYAWTSDPHVTVWKEEISFDGAADGYRVTDSTLLIYDSISSYEEFEEAYWGSGEYRFADYEERGCVEAINAQTLYDRESGAGTDRNAVYRSPRTAAEWILNLTGGKSVAVNDSSGQAIVKYTFADGSGIQIPMYNVNDTHTTSNTARQDTGSEDVGDVWIVDMEAWNAKAL